MLAERRRVLVDDRRNEVIGYDLSQKLKPEDRERCEHRAFARYRLMHHYIEGRNTVRRDDQQFVFNCINVPYFSPSENFDTGDAGLSYYVNRAASAAGF